MKGDRGVSATTVLISLSVLILMAIRPFTVLQWNSRGLTLKIDDIWETYIDNLPDIMVFQETNLLKHVNFEIKGYNIYRFGEKNSGRGVGKGILTAIKDNHTGWVTSKTDNEHAQILTTEIYIEKKHKINISNIYRKSAKYSREEGCTFWEMLDGKLENHILVGDYNAHHTLWFDDQCCGVGNVIADRIIGGDCHIYNEDARTFRSREGARDTAVDLTIASNLKSFRNLSWETVGLHGSDHHPILSKWGLYDNNIRIEGSQGNQEERVRFKYEEANWGKFKIDADLIDWVGCKDNNNNTYRKNLINCITEISKSNIPTKGGKQKENDGQKKRFKSVPWWNEEIRELKNRRDELFKQYTAEFRTIERDRLIAEYKHYRNKVGNLIKKRKKQYRIEQVENITKSSTDSQLWGFVRAYEGLSGKSAGVFPLTNTENEIIIDDTKKANLLGKHYHHVSSNNNYSDKFKAIKNQHATENAPLFEKKPSDNEIYNIPLTFRELKNVIKSKTNSSPGEDDITYEIFKNLPDDALISILDLFNNIWTSGNLPSNFKHAVVVPVSKAEKDPKLPSSYRPIALTDHLGKLLETMVTNRLTFFLESKGIISNEQSGFRGKRQCLDHLARLVGEVQNCRKLNRQTAAVFLDLEKAYDQLWRGGALEELQKAGITGQMYNYVQDFLKDRTFQVRVEGALSKTYIQENGTPQGSVLSPTIFNLVLNRVTRAVSEAYKKVTVASYADDSALWVNSEAAPRRLFHNKKKQQSVLASAKALSILEPAVERLISDLESNGFKVNVGKTQCIVFDSDHVGKIRINNQVVESSDSVQYLGMIIDKKLTFKKHIDKLRVKGEKALRILSYMSGTNWGLSVKHRKLIFKNFILPKITYGEEIFSQAPKSYLKSLDTVQNQALRIISRNLKKTNIEILHVINQVDTLKTRRLKKQLSLYTRFNQNRNNPARLIYRNIKPLYSKQLNRLGHNRDNIIDTTIRSRDLCEIKNDMIAPHPLPIPFWNLNEMPIDISLSQKIDKKSTPSNIMRTLALSHLTEKYSSHNKIYTDASKEKHRVGIGIYEESSKIKLAYRLNDHLSITSGELIAIKQVLENALCLPDREKVPLCVCTDSLGACLALSSVDYMKAARPDIVVEIMNLHERLLSKGMTFQLVWIPSHVDIPGNEKADQSANEGRLKLDVDINAKLGYSEIKTIINDNINDKVAQLEYTNSINPKVVKFRKIFPNLKNKINLGKDQYLINRVRAGADRVNHFNEDLYCRTCREKLTSKHVVKHCTLFEKEREQVRNNLRKEHLDFKLSNILRPNLSKDTKLSVMSLLKKIDTVFRI